jgi:GGDEF domain-containing protein
MPLDTKDEDDLVLKADKAMYTAKQKGRNQVCCI